ncbi:MAG: hypothetical protein SFV23_15920 [Planctomycetaceae bacterium]|nr:hypothetical protein [Planctomycetaceae bacterium]
MFDWIRRVFDSPEKRERQAFLDTIDALNAAAGGGEPTAFTEVLGELPLRSGTLLLGDPQYLAELEVPGIRARRVTVSAKLWRHPSGATTVAALTLHLGDATETGDIRTIGSIPIDSAKLVVVDQADYHQHWTEVGKDRIGIISTSRNDTVLRLLTKRFGVKTVRVDRFHAEVVGPVSTDLERAIEEFLTATPEFGKYSFLHFRVQTNNSFDRVLHLPTAWGFLPVGNAPEPMMFACETGHGDGGYDVNVKFVGDTPQLISVTFIDE